MFTSDFEIQFENEDGIDAGGPTLEWINLVMKEVFDPNYGLFKISANGITI